MPDETWETALEDSAQLLPVRREVAERFPGMVSTISIGFGAMKQVSPTRVNVSFVLRFTDKKVPGIASTGEFSSTTDGMAVLVDGHWLVSGETYCSKIDMLMGSGLTCP
ncbi:hypothetical protein [Pseudofrankia asymbiotica]|uniref:SnoaL-like domain-containing protein n=1 Tax=Pseudofrankia asymbiotica TaxID=1834516 RepID=A0A1V2IHY4_9ACTN|nr:hypothetical protein [Pseudofrankia asymbiotica]ONH32793.1 hypothetical protein BL253_03380 [Pseudofrankia asymbiotica]